MNIRESLETLEESYMSPYTSLSNRTKGRNEPKQLCDMWPEYQQDRGRILHSKALRRLKHKTQVFPASEGDHCRTRLTHILEVSQIARTIAKTLRLNENLTGATTLSHNLGYTPFGHSGEYILSEICEDGFTYYERSIRVTEVLEKDGRGLSLTWEVRDGIHSHRTLGHPSALEDAIVQLSDKIAYINHGVDDATRARVFTEHGLSRVYTDVLGHSVRERLNNVVRGIILDSVDKPTIIMSEGMEEAIQGLRK